MFFFTKTRQFKKKKLNTLKNTSLGNLILVHELSEIVEATKIYKEKDILHCFP